MGERRSRFSFRFWSSVPSAPSFTPANQTTSRTSAPTNVSPAQTRTQRDTNTETNSSPSTSPKAQTQNQRASQSTTATPTSPPRGDKKEKKASQSTPTKATPSSATPLTAETKEKASESTGNIETPKTPPRIEGETGNKNTTSTTSPSADRINENQHPEYQASKTISQNSSPSDGSTQPHGTPGQKTPSQVNTQTGEPVQLSPTRAPAQTRGAYPSPSRTAPQVSPTSQKSSQSLSPSRLVSRSLKQTTSPSSKGTQVQLASRESPPAQKDPLSSSSEAPKSSTAAVPQEEPAKLQMKENVTSVAPKNKDFEHNDMETHPSKVSELGAATTILHGDPKKSASSQESSLSTHNDKNNPFTDLHAKPEEMKEVKEVVQEKKAEAVKEKSSRVYEVSSAKSGSSSGIVHNSEAIPTEKKEALAGPQSSSQRNRIINGGNHKKPVLPSRETTTLQKEIKDDISGLVNRMATSDLPHSANRPVNMITLSGENRGASMQLRSNSTERDGEALHIHRGYKVKPDESPKATTDGEGISKQHDSKDEKTIEDQPNQAYINNNTQAINNSIAFRSSITERNPGVHMRVSHIPAETIIKSADKTKSLELRKAEFSITPAEKLTYEPRIRRRCLRGLLLESSESEPEKPEKPQRHGCRVSCRGQGKYNEIDVL